MDPTVRATIEHCAAESHAGTTPFGALVVALAARGVESYRADYRRDATDYYLPSGETHAVPLRAPAVPIGDAFDAPALQAAIRGSQRGEVKYPEFLERSMAAGCVGYVVWIAGRHVTYFGRRGETHVEPFPPILIDQARRRRPSAATPAIANTQPAPAGVADAQNMLSEE